MTDLTKIDRPFGLLDEATQKALRECGGPWEELSIFTAQWWGLEPDDEPKWDEKGRTYRQAPQPPKPREWWIAGQSAFVTKEDALTARAYMLDTILVHVREVMPE